MKNKTVRSKLGLPFVATLPLGVLCSLNSCNHEKLALEKPNVIFIVLDDMNDFGIKGIEHVKVPHVEKFRNSAVTFTSANCPSPLCIPSRASFFTGIKPHHSGVYANGGDPWNNIDVLKQAETLPELFRRNGYYSFGRGRVYHVKLEKGRLEQNFDNRPIFEGGFGPYPDEDHQVFSEKDIFQQFWGVQSFPDSIFPDVINTDAVVDICGLEPLVQQLDGESLRSFLEKEGYSWDRPTITSLGENLVSIRSHKYRYIQYPDGESELYGIEHDQFEWTNLVDEEGMGLIVEEHQKYIPASFAKELPDVRRN